MTKYFLTGAIILLSSIISVAESADSPPSQPIDQVEQTEDEPDTDPDPEPEPIPEPEPEPEWPASMVSGTLPVIYVNTIDAVEIPDTKDYYTEATYWLDNMGIDDVEPIGSAESPLPTGIRRRGNYTWTGFDKKPYKLKFDKKASPLGMDSNKHWALMAGADGLLSNMVGFATSRAVGLTWTPTQKPVELVLNGEYRGLYFLCETIRVDKNRVNIHEQPDNCDDPEEVEGAWLLELDNYDEDVQVRLPNPHNPEGYIRFTPDTPEELSEAQMEYLTMQLTSIQNAIYLPDLSDNTWEEYIDVNSMARFYIVQEITINLESFAGSCYFYKDKGEDEKWHFGPVWDFGNAAILYGSMPNEFFYEYTWFNTHWIRQIVKHPHFIDVVRSEFSNFISEYNDDIPRELDAEITQIIQAAEIDKKRWPQYNTLNLSEWIPRLYDRFSQRIKWLEMQFGSTSVSSPESAPSYSITPTDGGIRIYASDDTTIRLSDISGRTIQINAPAGESVHHLSPGIYIAGNSKILVK